MRYRSILLGALLAQWACIGDIGDRDNRARAPDPSPDGLEQNADGSFVCDPDAPPSISPLRRLSVLQYENTLRDLFGSAIDAPTVAADEIARLPIDEGAFSIMDTRVSDKHVSAYYKVADKIATSVSTTDAALTAIAGTCALAAMATGACVDGFLSDFGMRALRRPLTPEEKSAYKALNDGTRSGRELFRSLIFVLLQAPDFAYHVELEGSPVGDDDNEYELDGYGLASRLSYHFWQSMPDEDLFAAAADGSLLTDDGYTKEVNRLFSDPRTKDVVATFYKEWWHVGWLHEFPKTPGLETLAEGTTIFEEGADHLQAMTDEIRALTEHFTFATEGTYRDLFVTDLSFTSSPNLASLYGVEPWDGSSEYPRMPAGQRAGILTRGSFLVNDNYETHPIHRGVTIRRRLLCEDIEPPDPSSLPPGSLVPPPISPDSTTRERYENKTSPEPCHSCHQQFNPIGYVLERYDALGRYRTEELVIDEATGDLLATLPVDSSASPKLSSDDDRVIDSGAELSEMVADDTAKIEPCFARQYFRYTYGRNEGANDACALESVRGALTDGGSLAGALRAIALEAGFRTRRAE